MCTFPCYWYLFDVLCSLPIGTAVPSTPSTACGSTYSAVTPATIPGRASSVWCQSSGGKTLTDSPTSSTSSATELDEGSTQLEPSANHQVDTSASKVEQFDNSPEKSVRGVRETYSQADTREASSSQSLGTKRPWEQTLRSHHPQHIQDGSGPRFTPTSDTKRSSEASTQALPNLVNHRRRNECLERSQYPRLDGHSTPAVGPRSHRNQLSNLVAEKSMRNEGGITAGAMFDGAMGSPKILGRGRRSQESAERADAEVAGNGGGYVSEQASTENVRAQYCMGSCGSGARADSCRGHTQEPVGGSSDPTDQSNGDGMAIDGAEHEPPSRGSNHRATSSRPEKSSAGKISGWLDGGGHSNQPRLEAPRPAVTCGDNEGRSEPEYFDMPVLVDARAEEAAALRKAGVTGHEEFKELMAKLTRGLKWRWGPIINSLSNDYWIMKRGAKAKTAKVGVDKFAERKDVVKYVRGVLGLAGVAMLDSTGWHSEEGNEGEKGAADDENGDRGVGRDEHEYKEENQEDEKEAKTATESKQPGPSLSTPKGRALQATLAALNPSNAPDVLQQRTAEFNQVLRFITNSVAKASGGSLYLCGVPGTGKTQTMAHVQAKVHKKYSKVHVASVVAHLFVCASYLYITCCSSQISTENWPTGLQVRLLRK